MKIRKVLVTGGAGFIGSHVVDAYVAAGLDVTVLDNLSTGLRGNVNPRATFVHGDLNDLDAVERAVSDSPDVLSHHAAQADLRKSVADPALDAETNITGALRVLEAARRKGAKKIVFASSGGAAYGEPQFYPQTEEHPTMPLSPYGCAKLSFEHYLFYYAQIHGLPYAALRYANVYGPRQRNDGEAGVVAIFAGRVLAGEAATINGDGGQTRDYVFVGDVVRANVAALEPQVTGAFNVGTGIETTVVELYQAIREIAGGGQEAVHAPAKLGEQRRSVLDGSRLRRLMNLPEPVSLRDGLRTTVASMR